MNKRDIFLFGIAAVVTIVLNILMMTVFTSHDVSISTNAFVIIITLFLLFLVVVNGPKIDKRAIRPERYGIWGLAAASLIWFINRVDPTRIPDEFNFAFWGFFVLIGALFITIALNRIQKNKK